MAEFDYVRVLREQDSLYKSINRIADRIMANENPPRQLLVGRLSNLQEFWERCRANHTLLQSNSPPEDESDDEEKINPNVYDPDSFVRMEESYEEVIDYILSRIPDTQPGSTPQGNETKPDVNRQFAPALKLPSISIPIFSGTYCEWLSFRDLFSSLVIDNESLSDAERLHYLKASLQGEALIVAQNQPGTSDNFQAIWKNLETRYDNCKSLIYEYLRKIVELPDVTSDWLNSLKSMRNVIVTVTTALQNLKRPIDEGNDLLVFLLINKLDKTSRDQWEMSTCDTTDPPSLEQFNKFLDTRIRTLEATSNIKKRLDSKSASTSAQSSRQKIHAHQNSPKLSCPLCKEEHNLYACPTFKNKTLDERNDYIRSNSRCFNCLGKHYRRTCQSKRFCFHCKKSHHSLLHRDKDSSSSPSDESKHLSDYSQSVFESKVRSEDGNAISSHLNATKKNRPPSLLATARVILEAPNGRCVHVRALLDQGSEATFVSESVVQLLRLPRKKLDVTVSGLGGNISNQVLHSVSIMIKSPKSCAITLTAQAFVIPRITAYVPAEFTLMEISSNLRELDLADPTPGSNDRIDLLIGADLFGQALLSGVCHDESRNLVAQNTVFGWMLSGSLKTSNVQTFHINVHHSADSAIDQTLRQFWELEEIPKVSFLTKKELECEAHFAETHSRDSSGRYIVKLPFSEPPIQLGDSRDIALSSLLHLEKRLERNEDVSKKYHEFMRDYESLGHMSRIGPIDNDDSFRVFIPHHPVLRDHSQTMKLRIVFNASRSTSTKVSINDCLHIGPKLQNDISSILLRWRQHRYVLCADIAHMFRQILVYPSDRKYQCILWREKTDEPVQIFELNTVTYGMSSSPYLAIRVIRQLVEDEKANFPSAASVFASETYVDDLFVGGVDKVSSLALRDELIQLASAGGFRLRKWFSNSVDLLSGLDQSDHGLAIELPFDNSSGFKVLGILWSPSDDAFRFHINEFHDKIPTKRSILSAVSKLYDPMGWLAPVTIVAKILLQKLWLQKLDWDHTLPSDLAQEWHNFRSKLPTLSRISISRWISRGNDTDSIEIHGFSDASRLAYSAVLYSRIISDSGEIAVKLLIAKTKVAPIKTVSIPHLELCAATLLTRLIPFVVSSLQLADVPIFCWTDSSIVLSWLKKQPATLPVFVANRISTIQTQLPSALWRHVPSKQNPADCASRGLSAEDLPTFSLWWEGPEWLSCPSAAWPQRNIPTLDSEKDDVVASLLTKTGIEKTEIENDWQSSLLSRQSSWSRLLRITAFVLRAVKIFKERVVFPRYLSATEINDSSLFWIRYVQSQSFAREIISLKNGDTLSTKSSLKRLNPFIDCNGIVRLGGRLRQSKLLVYQESPAILPKHPISSLILEQFHRNLLHAGIQLTLYMARTKYWIIGARSYVRTIVQRCLVCVRDKAKTASQLMGDLPTPRVTPSRPFSHTGIDYAGPYLIRSSSGRGIKSHKAWISIFVCFAVKAIHLELVHDYTTASFIAAFRRFVSRRGIPTDLYSDNGPNFRGADRELSQAFRKVQEDPNLVSHLASDGTTWHFIPPIAPHFGGLWEAGVKSVKLHLRKLLSNSTPTVEEFETLLCQIESCLNSRPLVPANDDPESCEVLTPGHFLSGTALTVVPTVSVLDVSENLLSRWQFYQRILEQFWRLWSRDYLQSLQQRTKWFSRRPSLKEGNLVLLKNANLPPAKWELARITKCILGRDGAVRVVHVKTAHSEFVRPISQLVVLPISNES